MGWFIIVLPTLVVIRGATTTTWSTSTQYLKTSISKQHCIGGRARRNHQRAAWHSWRLCCSLDDQGRDVAATKGWWLRGINGWVYGKIAGNHGFFMVFRAFDYWIWGFQQIFSGLVVSFTRLIFRLWTWDDDPQWLSFFHGGWTQPEMGDVLVFIINSRLHRLPEPGILAERKTSTATGSSHRVDVCGLQDIWGWGYWRP